MTRLIDANNLFEKVGNIKPSNKSEYELIGKFMNMITISTTVEQRPHGEWKTDGTCSECSVYSSLNKYTTYFCPNCGADMRKESDGK